MKLISSKRGWDKSQLKGKIYVACNCIANLVEVKGLEFEKTLKLKSFVLFLRLVLSQPLLHFNINLLYTYFPLKYSKNSFAAADSLCCLDQNRLC